MTTRQRVWTIGTLTALIWASLLYATAAWSQDVELPIDTVYRGDPGDIIHVVTIPAEPGADCTAVLESRNNDSVHPDSDILVGPVTFTNVESATFQAAGLTFISTGPINVAVRLGDDGVFSAGFTLEVACNPPTTTTTSIPSSSTTTTIVTSSTTFVPTAPTTTLSPPPVGGIETGGGACADGSCNGGSAKTVLTSAELAVEPALSPLTTWLLIGGVSWTLLAGLAWAFVAGGTRKETPK